MFAPLCKSKLGWQLHKLTEPRNHQEQKLPTMHQSLMRASQLQLPHRLINKTFGDWEKPEENEMCKQESWRWNDSTLKKQCIPGGKAGQSSCQKMPPASARGKGLETPWSLGKSPESLTLCRQDGGRAVQLSPSMPEETSTAGSIGQSYLCRVSRKSNDCHHGSLHNLQGYQQPWATKNTHTLGHRFVTIPFSLAPYSMWMIPSLQTEPQTLSLTHSLPPGKEMRYRCIPPHVLVLSLWQ